MTLSNLVFYSEIDYARIGHVRDIPNQAVKSLAE